VRSSETSLRSASMRKAYARSCPWAPAWTRAAFRLDLADTVFFEVDKAGLFDMKEPLLADVPLTCAGRRTVVGTLGEIDLRAALESAGFDSSKPTTWLMEGLLPYLTVDVLKQTAADLGGLSAPGSALWGDAFSKTAVDRGMVFHGVPFASGFDNYDEVFRAAGFDHAEAMDFAGISLDRNARAVRMDKRYMLRPETARGRHICLMVQASKRA